MRSSTIALLAAAATAPAANAAVFLACQSSLIEQGLLKGEHKAPSLQSGFNAPALQLTTTGLLNTVTTTLSEASTPTGCIVSANSPVDQPLHTPTASAFPRL